MYLKLIYYIITLNSRTMESVNYEDLEQENNKCSRYNVAPILLII